MHAPTIFLYESTTNNSPTSLQFSRSKHEEVQSRLTQLETRIVDSQNELKEFETLKDDTETGIQSIASEIDQVRAELNTVKEGLRSKTEEMNEMKKSVYKTNKDADELRRVIGSLDARVEELVSEWVAIIRKCKLEEIPVSLTKGSLEKLNIEDLENFRIQPEADMMDIDGEPETRSRISSNKANSSRPRDRFGVEVDFENMPKDQKNDGSEDMETHFERAIKNILSEIEKMAPNMKAIDR